MDEIKNLYDGINLNTIPENIYKELCKHSDIKKTISKRNNNGEFKTEITGNDKPLFMCLKIDENTFYINQKHLNNIHKELDLNNCQSTDGEILNRKTFLPYLNEYGKGFIKGYNEFEKKVKPEKSLFITTNEQITQSIYSRIKTSIFNKVKDGTFKLTHYITDIDADITFTIKKDEVFKNGFDGGEFYKAWEVILNNPTLFEDFFIDSNSKKEKTEIKQFPFYLEIGALFAQGFINKENKDKYSFVFYYQEKKFESVNQLSVYIKDEILKTSKSVRQYIDDTTKNKGVKNLYLLKFMEKTIEYCDYHKIKITEEYKSKYNDLKDLH